MIGCSLLYYQILRGMNYVLLLALAGIVCNVLVKLCWFLVSFGRVERRRLLGTVAVSGVLIVMLWTVLHYLGLVIGVFG